MRPRVPTGVAAEDEPLLRSQLKGLLLEAWPELVIVAEAGIGHRYEEFDDDHSVIDYRMDVSLPFLYRALK